MKFTSVLLCMAMLFGFATPSFAEENSADNELEKVVLEVKERLNIGDYEDFSSRIITQGDKKAYQLHWENSEKDYKSVNVVFSDGIISDYNYNCDSLRYNENRFPSVSYDDALAVAKEFIKNANPDIYESIAIIPNKNSKIIDSCYYFDLVRKENGITVAKNGGNIYVSKTTNEVTYFSIAYTPKVEFISTENVIAPEEAELKYVEKLPFELQYSCYYNYKDKNIKVFPQYNCNNDTVLNALTGEPYKLSSEAFDELMKENYLSGGSASDSATLSETEKIEIEKISGLITADQAKEAVIRSKAINMDSSLELKNIFLHRNYIDNDVYTYNMTFQNNDKYLRVELDAATGQILNFYKHGNYSTEKIQNAETEKRIAEEMLKALEAEKYAELRLSDKTTLGRVCYERIVNGITIDTDGVYFEFDEADNLTAYSFEKTNIKEFPKIDGVMTAKEAFDYAKEQLNFELVYSIDKNKGYPVYCFIEADTAVPFDLNPFTGIRIDYKGEEYSENIIYYTDIDNHYAKDKFLKLAEYGIGFSESKLEPSKEITEEEFEILLSKIFIYDEKKDRENTPLTRERAAVILADKIGCMKYLKYDEMFTAPFDDVFENKGSIAYLKAIGVISGDGSGSFRPKNIINRGEALIMLYNYLNRQENI